MQEKALSLYVHIPFCASRCHYCDFNTYAGMESLLPDYMRALCSEAELQSRPGKGEFGIKTIYFGGGTPTLAPVHLMQEFMGVISHNVSLHMDCEISMEANPGTVTLGGLIGLRKAGVNRISLGMQSADPGELRLLGRRHDFFDVINAVKWARTADFDNLSLDLIYGIPGQTLQNWQRTVKLVLGLKPDHLSLYALTIEEGTPMDHWIRRGRIARVDDDLAADMYDWAGEALEDQGFRQYEISNWARLDSSGTYYECRHNLQYWHNLPYLGLGCGAHGYLKGYRLANTTTIPGYIQAIALGKAREFPFSPATESAIPVSLGDEMEETMMLGLRLVEEGVSKRIFQRRFGVPLTDAFGEPITSLCRKGLLEWAGDQNDRLRLTRRGRLLGNQVFMQFVGGAVRT